MLHIYTARENVDKDRFMFGRIAAAMGERRVFLIVPEQSTLRAEADAFDYMDAPGFIDFDVLSMTSLGRRVLDDVGQADAPAFVSKYGKFMLLSRLMYRRGKELRAFKRLEPSPDFVERLSDMLSELKNHNVMPGTLREIASELEGDTILKNKLEDAALVYEGYEDAIGGKYMDQADHLKLCTSRMGRASFIPGAEFWYAGFDYLSPAVMDAVVELSGHAASVNVVLTADAEGRAPLFALTNGLAAALSRRAGEEGISASVEPIPADAASGYLRNMPPEIAHIERALFTRPHTPFVRGTPKSGEDPPLGDPAQDGSPARRPVLRLIAAANFYAEAETIAAEICDLVRDGLRATDGGVREVRYRDILVLCNDMAERGPVVRRVFRRYGLPVFMDRRRSVEHNPVIEFLLALPRIAASGRRYEDVFSLLKTGLTEVGADEVEELENYVVKYKVRGKRWDRDFTLGLKRRDAERGMRGEYEQGELDALNDTRRKVLSLIAGFEKGFKDGKSAKERTDALLSFLTEDAKLPAMIERYTAGLEDAGMLEYASEMSGMWDVAEEIFGQMSTVLGDLTMSAREYVAVLRTGLDSVRIGVLPTVIDQIVLGTMQRTRSGRAKAVFVLGANDGVLPASAPDGAIFSEDEVYRLVDAGHGIARTEETAHMEEELAIYRNLSKPQALLRVSYAASDSAGKNINPSPVFARLRRIFPDVPIEKDIGNVQTGDVGRRFSALRNVQHPDQSLDNLASNLREYVNGGLLPEAWRSVAVWYRLNRPGDLARVKAGLTFRGRRERVGPKFLDGLCRRVTSPSALEKYSRCPFSWFMSYGLNLRERRVAGMDDRSIGDVYHNVLMRFGRELSADGLPAKDERSRWHTITDEEIDETARRLVREEYSALAGPGAWHGDLEKEIPGGPSAEGTPGLVAEGISGGPTAETAENTYRMERVSRTAALSARALARQIREGAVENIYYESSFGKDGDFPPISIPPSEGNLYQSTSNPSIPDRRRGLGRPINVEGRIDRVDVLSGGFVRVVDYKSGMQEFSASDAASGFQLQLMLYMQAVAERYEPAGVFYFMVREPRVKDTGGADVSDKAVEVMKLDGVAVDDARILDAMGMASGGRAGKGRVDRAVFDALRESVRTLVEGLAGNLSSGLVDADPKTAVNLTTSSNRNMKACDYCAYKGICNYFPGN